MKKTGIWILVFGIGQLFLWLMTMVMSFTPGENGINHFVYYLPVYVIGISLSILSIKMIYHNLTHNDKK